MVIEVHSEFAMTRKVTPTENELDKRTFQLLSSELFFRQNNISLSVLKLLPDFTVELTGLAASLDIPLNEYLLILKEIKLWTTFIQKELSLSSLPALKGEHELKIAANRETIDFTAHVMNPGRKNLVDGVWTKATGIVTFRPLPTTIVPWGDFAQMIVFLGHAFEVISQIV